MAKKKTEKPAYGERPTPVTPTPAEPKKIYIPIPDKEVKKK